MPIGPNGRGLRRPRRLGPGWAEREMAARAYPRRAEPARGVAVSRSGSVEAEAPPHLVLVHDRVGVAAGDAGVVGQPVGLFFAAEERGARFDSMEPLSEGAAGRDRNARNETTVQIR